MSGLEIAGLVVGVIPLIDLYRKSLRNFFRHGRVFDDLEVQLRLAMANWGQTCETLLIGLSLPIDLLDDEKGWEDHEIQAILEERMGKRYFDVLKDTASYIRGQLLDLQNQMEPPEDWQARRISHGDKDKVLKGFFRNHLKQIKGGFKSNQYGQTIKNINDCIHKLGPIIPKAIHSEEQRRIQKRSKSTMGSWNTNRDHSQRLLESLRTFWSAQKCPSHLHSAHMRLSVPSHIGSQLDLPDGLGCSFILKNMQDASNIASYHATVIPISAQDSDRRDSGVPTIILPPEDSSEDACDSKVAIDDLCINLSHGNSKGACRGFLAGREWHYHIHDDGATSPAVARSLREAILGPDAQPVLSTREKRTISLLLASAVLQLHGTSWLRRAWTLDDILISNPGGEIRLSVAKDFEAQANDSARYTDEDHGLAIPHNEMVFSLGIALLELNYRRQLSPLNDALLYAKRVQNDELQNFSSAVASCIFHNPSVDFGSDGLFGWFCHTVIAPLQDDYDMLQRRMS